eukprot:TRINITY_DN24549_c0_g1_i6.p1 TRINITY_DN24549_c0_g1~~TRINITY_DN24549_c0_g1_i6.p1  ORF type:complete len:155 (-),score=9.86 TRINITY_DN24549_c0_g1_i6:201-665(-)
MAKPSLVAHLAAPHSFRQRPQCRSRNVVVLASMLMIAFRSDSSGQRCSGCSLERQPDDAAETFLVPVCTFRSGRSLGTGTTLRHADPAGRAQVQKRESSSGVHALAPMPSVRFSSKVLQLCIAYLTGIVATELIVFDLGSVTAARSFYGCGGNN